MAPRFERLWQATPGKAVCGLLVVRPGGSPPSSASIIIRAGAFVIVPALALQLLMLLSPAKARSQRFGTAIAREPATLRGLVLPDSAGFVANGLNFVMLGLFFSTVRRRNGYAALHDLLSGTRVVERRALARPRVSTAVLAEADRATIRRLGPFAVTSTVVPAMPDGWRSGFDERLRRPVWIREVPPGTPAMSSGRAAINRPSRLRGSQGDGANTKPGTCSRRCLDCRWIERLPNAARGKTSAAGYWTSHTNATPGRTPTKHRILYTATLIEPDLRPDLMTLLFVLTQVAIFAHVNALLLRGGVIRVLGLEFVTADGKQASRYRVLARTAATWAPLMIVAPPASPAHWLTYPCLLMLFAGAVVAILAPERGLQDRLAGTWIVPR